MSATELSHEAARDEYRRLLLEYRDALAARQQPAALRLWERLTVLWNHLCSFSAEEAAEPSMHYVLTFAAAVDANDEVEAERLYHTMSDEYRATVDAHDTLEPGSMKIWQASLRQER